MNNWAVGARVRRVRSGEHGTIIYLFGPRGVVIRWDYSNCDSAHVLPAPSIALASEVRHEA